MSQIIIQLDDHLEQHLIALATNMNLSIEKFIANLLAQSVHNDWHPSISQLVGAWSDDDHIQPIQTTNTMDSVREQL